MSHRVIAIDGPAASGKSSVARALAQRLGFVYVNSGAMYRAVAWQALRTGIAPDDAPAVIAMLDAAKIECAVENSASIIRVDGIDPGAELTSDAVNASVSPIAAISEVRRLLVALQRRFADASDIVMEGRDIGSVVFPDTTHKFYIDASPEVRAQRRRAQGLADAITARDQQDSSRADSPLTLAPGAIFVDTSALTIDGVVAAIVDHLRAQGMPGLAAA